jgi:hypothetical protein
MTGLDLHKLDPRKFFFSDPDDVMEVDFYDSEFDDDEDFGDEDSDEDFDEDFDDE